MQIDVAPTDHRAVLDGCQQFLSVLNVFLLGDFLGEIQVVPADNGIFDQASASFGNLLLDLFAIQEVTVIPEGYRLRELVGALALVQLLFDRLISLGVCRTFIRYVLSSRAKGATW
jgi:hypothetical protein